MISLNALSLFTSAGQAILSDVSLVVAEGESVALVGPSGCGKSTLLRSVCGGVERWIGEISVGGVIVTPHSIAKIRSSIGYIPQEPRLPEQTVEKYLETFILSVAKTWDEGLLERAMALFDTVLLPPEIWGQSCRLLSGGQRQRVAIVAVLLLERPILLADEVTSALDQQAKQKVMDLLFSLDCTLLSVGHDADWLARCDRTVDVRQLQGGLYD